MGKTQGGKYINWIVSFQKIVNFDTISQNQKSSISLLANEMFYYRVC